MHTGNLYRPPGSLVKISVVWPFTHVSYWSIVDLYLHMFVYVVADVFHNPVGWEIITPFPLLFSLKEEFFPSDNFHDLSLARSFHSLIAWVHF
jgi:hypothetical protein